MWVGAVDHCARCPAAPRPGLPQGGALPGPGTEEPPQGQAAAHARLWHR